MDAGETIVMAIGAAVLVVIVVLGVGLLLALPVMWLWNWLMPTIFGIKVITFWQSWGIMVLSGILFKSTVSSK